jgi:hypothetical protein
MERCVLLAATLGGRYEAISWAGRPDKQSKLRLTKLLLILLFLMAIPVAICNWFWT